jgi:hypothetical protein
MATAELTIDTGVGVYVKIVSIAIRQVLLMELNNYIARCAESFTREH